MKQELNFLSLVNGTDIVAGLLEETEQTLVMNYPLKIIRGITADGEYSIVTDYVPYQVNETVTFDKRSVIARVSITSDELTGLYTSYLMKHLLKGFENEDLTEETGTCH